ncbi:hypothetical protein PCASD_11233 [Puccinia coronata f. sp. avenae]|uniref:Uncharacterized protein n=1 Tax=Puccinia coronata f. sp. avenae TaxID=200324 RepID=A0A2N5UBM8_9BASI|nr:hypothetical protein PCASD_11233 [Puccinia coronata f. sp. avenae]
MLAANSSQVPETEGRVTWAAAKSPSRTQRYTRPPETTWLWADLSPIQSRVYKSVFSRPLSSSTSGHDLEVFIHQQSRSVHTLLLTHMSDSH